MISQNDKNYKKKTKKTKRCDPLQSIQFSPLVLFTLWFELADGLGISLT